MERRMCGCGVPKKSKEERNADLRKDAARIVAGVENYSGADRMKRAAEVKAAFPPVKAATAKTATRTTAKSTAKPAAKKSAPVAAAKKSTTAAATKKSVAKRATPMKASPKGPTPAGMSVGSHDGEVC